VPLPQPETPGRLQAELMSRGLHMTRQRRTILSVVETAKQHLDAAQILRRARELDPGVDGVTVYRTLNLLKRYRLVDELDLMHLEGGKHFYERQGEVTSTWPACAAARSGSLRAIYWIVGRVRFGATAAFTFWSAGSKLGGIARAVVRPHPPESALGIRPEGREESRN